MNEEMKAIMQEINEDAEETKKKRVKDFIVDLQNRIKNTEENIGRLEEENNNRKELLEIVYSKSIDEAYNYVLSNGYIMELANNTTSWV